MPTHPHPGRILFAALPSAGLINPLLAVAAELAERGVDDLWFASTDDRRDDVAALPGTGPVRFVSFGRYKPELDPTKWDDAVLRSMAGPSRLRSFAAFITRNIDHGYADQQYRRALAVLDQVRPALAVIDLCTPWAIDAAMTRRIPYVLTVPVPVSGVYSERLPWSYPTPFSGLPAAMTTTQRIANVLFRIGTRGVLLRPGTLLPMVAAARRRKAAGVRNPAALPSRYADAAAAVLVTSIFGLEVPFPVDDRVRMVGPIVRSEEDGIPAGSELGAWLAAHPSVVYVGLGTIARVSQRQVAGVLELAARLGPEHHVLWKLPRDQQRLLPAELPPNLRVESWVPSQLGVLAHPSVRVFVNHGGGNAVHEALAFGKPQVVMPFWMDCHDLAARVTEAGAGRTVPYAAQDLGDRLTDAVTTVLREDRYARRAEFWAGELRAAGGVRAAADVVLAERDRGRNAQSVG
ncbi:glycosyltransferase [Micromonospora eburnea]|uniref:Polyene glycosyltransferase n=1 Tax=Micromonospora eburnea TaxID=227316 RepID=A0A1C6UZ91_9ACTN|nr:glycosyltransferase [Micromonospora eburnea]SCL59277.1 polyene glycosyltransferase [Micromonospora eburnea]